MASASRASWPSRTRAPSAKAAATVSGDSGARPKTRPCSTAGLARWPCAPSARSSSPTPSVAARTSMPCVTPVASTGSEARSSGDTRAEQRLAVRVGLRQHRLDLLAAAHATRQHELARRPARLEVLVGARGVRERVARADPHVERARRRSSRRPRRARAQQLVRGRRCRSAAPGASGTASRRVQALPARPGRAARWPRRRAPSCRAGAARRGCASNVAWPTPS